MRTLLILDEKIDKLNKEQQDILYDFMMVFNGNVLFNKDIEQIKGRLI